MRRLSRLATVALVAMVLSPSAATAEPAGAYCPPGRDAQFVLGFADLKVQVGGAMGEAVECEHGQANGDTLQRTSTGLAVYARVLNTPTFTDGHQHWALTADGVVAWTAGWHAGFAPPSVATRPDQNEPFSTAQMASVEVVRLVALPNGSGSTLVVERGTTAYRLEVGDGCPGASQAVGQDIFLVFRTPMDRSNVVVIFTGGHQECPILTMVPAEAAP